MTDITAHLQTLIGHPAPPGSTIEFYRTELSGVTPPGLEKRTLLGENPVVYAIVDGEPSPPIVGLPGGPMYCRIKAGGFRRTYPIVLPESGTVLLQNLLEDAIPWDPPYIHEGRQILAEILAARAQTLADIEAAKAIDVLAKARRERILSALESGGHRMCRILSIGDDFAEASGQSSPEFGFLSQLAERFYPGRVATWIPQTGDETQTWELPAHALHGNDGSTIQRVLEFPWGRVFGGDIYLTITPGATRKRFMKLYWANKSTDTGNTYAETISWRREGETAWRTVYSWDHGGLVWDTPMFSMTVDLGDARAIEITAANDPQNKPMLYLGASICDEPISSGVEVFNLGWDGTDMPWWDAQIEARPLTKTFMKMVNPDIIHISSLYYDIDGGVAELYGPKIISVIENIRAFCGADIPVLGSIRPLPDVTHPDWKTGAKKDRWDAYKAEFRSTVESMGGTVLDFDTWLGPMSSLPLATTSGAYMAREDRGLRTGPAHLSNVGAAKAARLAGTYINEFEKR